jgi:hypothetical protein
MHGFELARMTHMLRTAAVLVVEQHDEIRMRGEVVERTRDQLSDRLFGRQALEIELALLLADLLIDPFEYRQIERVLVTEIMIDELLVDSGAGGDVVDPGAGEAAIGKFPARRGQQLVAGAGRVAALRPCAA